MTYIPKTQESEYKRRIRLMQEKIDELAAQCERVEKAKAEQVKLPDVNEAIPNCVHVAMAYVNTFRQSTMPMLESSDIEIECWSRTPEDSELDTLSAANELLADYFDRHNSRVLRERQRAELVNQATERRGKRAALKVTPEEHDE